MVPRDRPNPLAGLVVVNFLSKDMAEDTKMWKRKRPDILAASNCARQVWLGFEEDFHDFPLRQSPVVQIYKDKKAYQFTLRLVCGLNSDRTCEPHVKGQVYEGWNPESTSVERAKRVDRILQGLKADSRYIQEHALASHLAQRHEIAARDLSGQQKGDKILVIGSLNRHGKISSLTDGIIRVSGNDRAGRVGSISVMHPDSRILSTLYDDVFALKARGIIVADIKRTGFDNLSQAIEEADRVYVDLPMGQLLEADQTIVETWLTRIARENTLTHLRGNPLAMGCSTDLWQKAELDNYFSPEAIRSEMARRAHNNQVMFRRADNAIAFCAETRMQGRSPSHRTVAEHLRSMQMELAA